ncbi:hypothetical protein [Deefgea rivuli]|uniref:hypothetical protein n=1 Tax=Deefgea rivuli TaxID=400948 RepID=UPI0012EBB846|nr:hypothetical protein [Deefgea rivuli]
MYVFTFILKLCHQFFCWSAAIDFPSRVRAGEGLCITHGWGLVINPHAQIGSNVTLFHGVTLGARHIVSSDGRTLISAPIIEDEVWIGPHAVIVG